jgi:hypothetical protein
MYTVFTKLGDGELLFVASRNEVEQAVRLAEELNETWPREYVVRDSEGNDVNLNEYPTIQTEARAVPYAN